ncbi:MAG TPA: PQQ-binding-like beta-propeller repeat protein [Thermoanaerobaculia bacterium]|nr:PQQ-binding-like beta-propeller repeat protein [Thermoanaerobaculia bacterium]
MLAALALPAVAGGSDWPQWRGPDRTGVVDVALPDDLPSSLEPSWRVEVGEGHASPVVAGDRLYVHARRGEQEVVAAFDLATGEEVWAYAVETPYQMNPAATGHGKGPKSTPVVAGERLCTFGISGTLACLDRGTGKALWSKSFEGRWDAAAPDFGTALSPLVLDAADGREMLIAHVGGNRGGALTAFQVADGAEVWSWNGDAPAYTSPMPITIDGVRQVVTQSRDHLVAVDAADGELLWSRPFTTAYKQNIVTPVVAGGGLIVFSGLDEDVFALRARRPGNADGWSVEEVWRNEALPMYMSSPVLVGSGSTEGAAAEDAAAEDVGDSVAEDAGGTLYGFTHKNRGQLFALDAATGETLWTSEGRLGENASLVVAGDRLLALLDGGELLVAAATREGWRPEKRYPVASSATWAHLVVLDGRLLIKDRTTLALFELE